MNLTETEQVKRKARSKNLDGIQSKNMKLKTNKNCHKMIFSEKVQNMKSVQNNVLLQLTRNQ